MIHQKIPYTLKSVFNAFIFKSNEYFLNYELLNELITQNIIIFDQKWQEDRSRNN